LELLTRLRGHLAGSLRIHATARLAPISKLCKRGCESGISASAKIERCLNNLTRDSYNSIIVQKENWLIRKACFGERLLKTSELRDEEVKSATAVSFFNFFPT